ncbi:hypothetical protein AKJ56_00230 [candidate division MSBL1 archaeon SCGC-AAA382N08]|uniref:Uncharacterized protein n=1 Tax=candidate division MSBL1 archaeon SCGC-AAA382N08 TaxID=1698285 RepID=A0A133VQR6_9EURY|nr:hypothetical protein AKJ56_00230 [candidate division MSBL1 archaeon SCGC-AAA382N08]
MLLIAAFTIPLKIMREPKEEYLEPSVLVYKTPEGPSVDNVSNVWEKVKDRNETKFVTSENNPSALIYIHPYSVGAFDPKTAEIIIILSSSSEGSVKTAIFRLDFQTNQLKKAYTSNFSKIEKFTLENAAKLMEGKIAELAYGEKDIIKEEVEDLHPYFVYTYPAGDFGGTLIIEKRTGKLILYATTVWDGRGELLIPQDE